MKIKLAILLACFTIAFQACKKDKVTPPNNNDKPDTGIDIPTSYVKLGETHIPALATKVVVYAEKNPISGYVNIYTALYDSASGARVKTGKISLQPIMDMGMMVHSAPCENTTDSAPSNQLWKTPMVFIMPGMWKLNITYTHSSGKSGLSNITFNVANPSIAVMKSFIAAKDDSAKVFVSLVNPFTPKIGLNDFEITIHTKKDMMNFPAVNNYTVEIRPEMPSMGHGSPNNENPTFIGNGHYLGKVNFTMTGGWRINLTIKKNGVVIDDTQYFDVNL